MVCKTGGAAALRVLALGFEAFGGAPVFRSSRGPFSAVSTPAFIFGCFGLHLVAPEIEAAFVFGVAASAAGLFDPKIQRKEMVR